MTSFPILSFLLFSPLLAAVLFVILVNKEDTKSVYNTGVLLSCLPLIIALVIFSGFDTSIAQEFQYEEKILFKDLLFINYHLGVDGVSLIFIMLTAFLVPICIVISKSVKERLKEYIIAFLCIEAGIIGVFLAMDLLLFYVLFEIVLIPMYLIVGIWGGERRGYSAYKLFLYTLFGSLPFLLAIIFIYSEHGTTDYSLLLNAFGDHSLLVRQLLWLCFFISFAVKLPMWPFHSWLPDVHVQAPTAGSVLLAGILIKFGGYGMFRYLIPMFPQVSIMFADYVIVMGIIAIIYTSMVALVQSDIKKMIAYSSVAHMGYVTVGLFSFSSYGINGALIQMVSHGIVSAALFICVGYLYDQIHSRNIDTYGGVMSVLPNFSFFFLLFTMASIGLPGTSGFIGEFSVILGISEVSYKYAILSATGVVLGACYMLYLYARVYFGRVTNNQMVQLVDLNSAYYLVFLLISAFIILIGFYPSVLNWYFVGSAKNLYQAVNVY